MLSMARMSRTLTTLLEHDAVELAKQAGLRHRTMNFPQLAWLLILGMWWEAPRAPAWRIHRTLVSADTPFTLDVTATHQGYPSRHVILWMFLGLILTWLVWKHARKRLLCRLLLVITLGMAFGGGLLLVYTGSHLATDLLAGYLIGASAACCAIGPFGTE